MKIQTTLTHDGKDQAVTHSSIEQAIKRFRDYPGLGGADLGIVHIDGVAITFPLEVQHLITDDGYTLAQAAKAILQGWHVTGKEKEKLTQIANS